MLQTIQMKLILLWSGQSRQFWAVSQFQNYLNGKVSIDSQEIIQFLNFSWQTKNMAVGSMVNLKVRLSLAYKKYTGTPNSDFHEFMNIFRKR